MTLHYGPGAMASLAARCRSSSHDSGYYTGTMLEMMFGERRTWDEHGQTMYATFPSPWLMDQDRRCADRHLSQAHEPPLPWTTYTQQGANQ